MKLKTFTNPENIEYTLFFDGKFKIKVKDLDSDNVISLCFYPSEDMAVKAFDLYIENELKAI
jgi:hypothetical protein